MSVKSKKSALFCSDCSILQPEKLGRIRQTAGTFDRLVDCVGKGNAFRNSISINELRPLANRRLLGV